VLNLFGEPRLNHHTQVLGGVLAGPCGELLREFFAQKRARRRALREGAIPTGEAVELDPPPT
jgi:tRNA(adenine34) deaminase